jgi:ufm1-conjugating enzyme 1
MVDEVTKKTLAAIPLLKTNSGPRDKENWVKRLKEEYAALIKV